MRIQSIVPLVVTALVACEAEPGNMAAAAGAQAELVTDTGQARMWSEASAVAPPGGVPVADSDVVRTAARTIVAERPAQATQAAFPEAVTEAVVMHGLPELDSAFSGPVAVREAQGEFLVLELGAGQSARLQVKVRGGPIVAQAGDQAQLTMQVGDPFARNDILYLRLPRDEVVHALVGSNGPVEFTIPDRQLSAAQTGSTEGNVMAVVVRVGRETHTLQPGEQIDFRTAGLTIKLVASIAVQGEAANALPGRPYRVELLGWRTDASDG